MKKYLYLLMMLACVSFVSCGSDDDNDGGSGAPTALDGSWVRTTKDSSSESSEIWTFNRGKFVYVYHYNYNYGSTHISKHQKIEGVYTVDVGSHVLNLTSQRGYDSKDGTNWTQTKSGESSQSATYIIMDGTLTITFSDGSKVTLKRETSM